MLFRSRNIVFRDGKDRADQVIPFSSYDSLDPEDLWDWMESYQSTTGGHLLAIPHNGNLSNGLMFDDVTFTSKKPLDREYAERRMHFEPVYEVTQIKGDGEAHPLGIYAVGFLEQAGIKRADMVIAVTSNDEVNLVVSMLAKAYGVAHRIALAQPAHVRHTRAQRHGPVLARDLRVREPDLDPLAGFTRGKYRDRRRPDR